MSPADRGKRKNELNDELKFTFNDRAVELRFDQFGLDDSGCRHLVLLLGENIGAASCRLRWEGWET